MAKYLQIFASSVFSILGCASVLSIEKLVTETQWGHCLHHLVLFRGQKAFFHASLPTAILLGSRIPSWELSVLDSTRRGDWTWWKAGEHRARETVEGREGLHRAEGTAVETAWTAGDMEQAAAFLSLVHEGDFPLDLHLALKWK